MNDQVAQVDDFGDVMQMLNYAPMFCYRYENDEWVVYDTRFYIYWFLSLPSRYIESEDADSGIMDV